MSGIIRIGDLLSSGGQVVSGSSASHRPGAWMKHRLASSVCTISWCL